MIRLLVSVSAFVVLVGCGGAKTFVEQPAEEDAGEKVAPCELNSQCPLGKACVQGQCGDPVAEDAGRTVCDRDEHCDPGYRCLLSTGQCVLDTTDAGVVMIDAGNDNECTEGETASC